MKRFRAHPFLFSQAILSILFLLLYFAFRLFPRFAEGYAATAGTAVRLFLAKATGWLPFSLYEALIALMLLYLLFLLGFCVFLLLRKIRRKKKTPYAWRFLIVVPVVLSVVFNLFCLTLAPCYYRKSVAEQMGLKTEISEDEVFFALEKLVDEINAVAPLLIINEKGESECPYSFAELSSLVFTAADSFAADNPFYQSGGAAAKRLLVSPWMTYTHISGVYGFFTGEANVNTNYPHFILTATIAHEYSHARGIAPENECNFLAFAVCLNSDNAYLRYCAAAFTADNFAETAMKLDEARCREILSRCDAVLFADYAAYNEFMKPYTDSPVAEAADAVNSAYLKSQGQAAGTVSYSQIIELCTGYLNRK